MLSDKFREECGLAGVWNHREAANLAYLGLYAQQHRGQEGAGVVSLSDRGGEGAMHTHRGMGLVNEVFGGFEFGKLPGDCAIGHVRYTTAGGNLLCNVQPFLAQISIGTVALAHNGNLVNADELRRGLIERGAIFGTTSDTEIFLHLLAQGTPGEPVIDVLVRALGQVAGAYSLVILFQDRLIALRDPQGFRPLVMGQLGDGIIFASETCAFDLIGATYIRDVEPGEIVEVTGNRDVRSYFPFGKQESAACIFEYVYFARPDSDVFGKNVYPVRKRMGEELALESPVSNADLVIPVPDSGVPAAIGYAQAAQLPLELGLIRNHYVGRTFIEPKQSIRDFGVKIKLNANSAIISGKSIVVVDDSIVRGTTSRKLVMMLRNAGAREVHLRISAPPTLSPCYYGVDTPSKDELIASKMTIEEIRQFIGVDSLGYLTLEGLYKAVGAKNGFCDACFSGRYPVGVPAETASKKGLKIVSV